MVDELLHADEKTSRTRFTIKEENVLVENGLFSEAGIMENIAQTAAAGEGFRALNEQRPVSVGYIGAIRNFQVHELPRVGETLQTEIIILDQVFQVCSIDGRVFRDDQLIASCEMKLFIENQG